MMTTAGSLALAGAPAAAGRVRRRAAARGGRGDPRQDEPQRVGELPVDALVERLERPRRTDAAIRTRSIAIRRARAPARAPRSRPIWRAAAVGTETDGSIVSPSNNNVARRHQADARPRQPHAASFRSRTARTRRVRWPARSPTPRRCSARMAGVDPDDAATTDADAEGPARLLDVARPRTACAARASASSAIASSATAPPPIASPKPRSPT